MRCGSRGVEKIHLLSRRKPSKLWSHGAATFSAILANKLTPWVKDAASCQSSPLGRVCLELLARADVRFVIRAIGLSYIRPRAKLCLATNAEPSQATESKQS